MSSKSFKCDQCSLTFTQASNMYRHKSQKHPKLKSNVSFQVTDSLTVAMSDFKAGKITQTELLAFMQNPESITCEPTLDIGYMLSSTSAEERVDIYKYVKQQLVEAECFDIVKSYLKDKDYTGAFKVAFNKQIYYEDQDVQYLADGQILKIQVSPEFLVGQGDNIGLLMIIVNTVEYDLIMSMQTMIKGGADIESIIGPTGITKQIDDLKIPLYGNANKHRIYENILTILDDFSIPLEDRKPILD
jgi:hypothetical protein